MLNGHKPTPYLSTNAILAYFKDKCVGIYYTLVMTFPSILRSLVLIILNATLCPPPTKHVISPYYLFFSDKEISACSCYVYALYILCMKILVLRDIIAYSIKNNIIMVIFMCYFSREHIDNKKNGVNIKLGKTTD